MEPVVDTDPPTRASRRQMRGNALAATSRSRAEPAVGAGLVCRMLRPGEAAVYRALRLDSLKRHPASFSDTFDEEACKPRLAFEAAIEEGLADRFVVGAFMGRRAVGIAGFARLERSKTGHRGAISHVYVDAHLRGRAVGRALMQATLAQAFAERDVEQVELGVVSDNVAALRLYETLGFRRFGQLANALQSDDARWTACQMVLTREDFVVRAALRSD